MSRQRWVQLLVLALLVAGGVWIARHTYWDSVVVEKALQGEAATNPFYTFERLAARVGVRSSQIATLRTLPPTTSVLVVNNLHGTELHGRLNEIMAWVQHGGRLLISRDLLLGTPALQSWSGVSLALQEPTHGKLTPAKPPPPRRHDADGCSLFVERLDGTVSGQQYRACSTTWIFSLASRHTPAWSLSSDEGLQMLRVAVGKGSLAVNMCDCLISNRGLLKDDAALIIFAAVALGDGDRLAILNPTDAEGLLSLLWRVAAASIVCVLVVVALSVWRNLPRFGSLAPEAPPLRRSLAEQLRANARFAWRTRHLGALRRAARDALEQTAQRRLASYRRFDADARMDALAAATGCGTAALSAALANDFRGGVEAELAAIALLETARRALSVQLSHSQGTRA